MTRISQLPNKPTVTGSEEVVLNDSGVSMKALVSVIAPNPVLVYTNVTSSSTQSPDPSVNTDVNGLSVTFTVAVSTVCRVDVALLKSGGHPDRYSIWEGAVQLYPTGTVSTVYDYSFGENGWYALFAFAILTFAPGPHTVNVKQNAALSTAAVTWYDRSMMVTKIA